MNNNYECPFCGSKRRPKIVSCCPTIVQCKKCNKINVIEQVIPDFYWSNYDTIALY